MITPTNEDGGLINQQFSMNVLSPRMGANDNVQL